MHHAHGSGARVPGQGSRIPGLIEIRVVFRVRNAEPADESGLNPFTGAIREVNVTNALRSQQPLVNGAGRHVDVLCFYICRYDAECLNCIHDEQRVMLSNFAAQTFQVDAESRTKLHVTNRHHARFAINQPLKLREIDAPVPFLAHANFDAKVVANTQPRIDIRRELSVEGDDVVAAPPVDSVGDGRESVGSVAYKTHLLSPGAEKIRQ